MIHHVSVGTNDVARSKRFYDAVLPLVGLTLMAAEDEGLGYGSGTFHFSVQLPIDGAPATVGNGSHIHAAALAHGGADDGAPGLRAAYDAHYYAAFVRDPDGHKIEVVTYAAT